MTACEDCGATCFSVLAAAEHCNPAWERMLDEAARDR